MKQLLKSIFLKLGLLKRPKEDPSLSPGYEEKRAIILSYKTKYNPEVFIETGTLFGDTVNILSSSFKTLYSIELSEELALKAQKRFASQPHITIVQGDSGEKIGELVNGVSQPILFWLDGHYSGDFIHNDELIRTAKGKLDTPIEKELDTILSSPYPHVILIDDARLFTGTKDYPTIPQVQNILKKSKFNHQLSVDRDIIRIVPTTKA